MTAAAVGADGFRTGMVVVAQSAGDLLNPNPHLHAIVPRGGWDPEGIWVPVPYVDTEIAERVFRAKVLTFLKVEGLLSEERERMLLSWNHHTGFSVHYDVIDKILNHLSSKGIEPGRGPPGKLAAVPF